MYKRRKRRGSNKTKGKRKDLSNPQDQVQDQDQDPSFTEEAESSFEEKIQPILAATPAQIVKIDMMSVTTMEQNVAGDQGKAVGARKRKPTQNRISKIVENSQQQLELDQDQDYYNNSSGPGSGPDSSGGLQISSSVNNNNSPPYKKPCLESNKNGMIKNILRMSELKTAKVSGNYQMPQSQMSLNSVNNSDEGDIDEDEDDEDIDVDEGELRIDVEGNDMTKISKKVKNLSPLRGRRRDSRNNKGNNNNNNENGARWSDEGLDDDENEMMNEGVDHIGSGVDDNDDNFKVVEGLPFRCGVCVYGSCDKSTLLRHMRTHSGERPFQCRLCYFAFTTKANCERHLKNRHGQIDRQQMRNLVVCYPSSSESETESSTIKKEKEKEKKISNANGNGKSNGKSSTPPPLISIAPSHSIMSIVGPDQQDEPLSLRKNDHQLQQQQNNNNNISIIEQHQQQQQRRRDSIGSGGGGGDDAPLDLSMDAVDLSTKMKESGFKRRSLFAPRPMYPTPEMSNLLVTSPFISKRQPMSHPGQLPLGTFGSHTLGQGGGVGPAGFSSLFPFSGPGGFNPFTMLPQANVEKLISLGSGGNSPPKVHNSFLTSSSPTFGNPHESLLMNSIVEPPSQKVSNKMPKNNDHHPDSKRSNHITNIMMSNMEPNNNNNSCRQPSSSPNSAGTTNTNSGSRKRTDSNGEYQKPKQRRYRTERPFACPHCPARFTLRSNMERHGKHQHPTVWQRSPSNRVINRQKNQQNSPLIGSSPTMVPPTSKYSSFADGKIQGLDKNTEVALQNVNVRQLISQQLKRKLSNSSIKGRGRGGGGGGGDADSSDENIIENSKLLLAAAGVENTTDLASVSQLLDRVKNSNFAQYFGSNEGGGRLSNEMHSGDDDQSCGDEDEDNMMDDDEEGRVGAGESGGDEDDPGQSTDDDDDGEDGDFGKVSGNEKKKSAYSSAPHKINCPHCSRKFPWTSSLRRHLLTHTGQKPYQCPDPECNLLFTTKSNCDRHLIRKHGDRSGRRARRVNGHEHEDGKNSSSGGTTEEDDENDDDDQEQEQGQVDDEVVKACSVKKPKISPINTDVTSTTPTAPTGNEQKLGKLATPTNGSPGEDATFRCHLCEASAQERDTLLNHMEEEHKDTFLMLMSKGALTSSPPSENSENDNISPPSTTTTATAVLGEKEQQTHRKIICVLCLRKFWSVEDLRRHMRSHSGERPFSCQLCSRKFTLKHSMLRHLKKHSASNTPLSGTTISSIRKGSKVLVGDVVGKGEPDDESDLIGRLLGINDEKLVEQLLNNPDAKDAAKILGLAQAQQALKKHITSTTK